MAGLLQIMNVTPWVGSAVHYVHTHRTFICWRERHLCDPLQHPNTGGWMGSGIPCMRGVGGVRGELGELGGGGGGYRH